MRTHRDNGAGGRWTKSGARQRLDRAARRCRSRRRHRTSTRCPRRARAKPATAASWARAAVRWCGSRVVGSRLCNSARRSRTSLRWAPRAARASPTWTGQILVLQTSTSPKHWTYFVLSKYISMWLQNTCIHAWLQYSTIFAGSFRQSRASSFSHLLVLRFQTIAGLPHTKATEGNFFAFSRKSLPTITY